MHFRSLLFVSSLFFLTACGEEKVEQKKNLLSTDIVNNPQSAEGLDTVAYNKLPTMDFKDTVHDFGNISEGQKATYDFAYTNNGNSPLIISNITGSCGCTVASYDRKPKAPGESGTIKVLFNSIDKYGHQEKSVAITTNSKRGVHVLYIKADVLNVQ